MAPIRIDMKRILCPVDFSEFSRHALERAVRLADWFDAEVVVLHRRRRRSRTRRRNGT